MSPVDSLRTETKFKNTEIGEIPVDWAVVQLRDISQKPEYGYTTSAIEKPVGPKFLRITDIQNGHVNWSAVPYCDCPDSIKKKYILKSGDILFARTGATTGKSFLIQDCPEAVFASYLIKITPTPTSKINSEFLYFVFNSHIYWKQIRQAISGSAQGGINSTVLSKIRVPLPPFIEQGKIADILGSVDEAIEKKQQIIEKTNKLKKGLMQELLTRGIGHTKFKKTEIGEIPAQWRIKKLREIGRLRGGSGFPEKYQGNSDREYPFIKVSDMNLPGNEIYLKHSANTIDINIKEELGCHIFPKDTIVFAKVGAALLLNRRRILTKESCIDNNMMGLEISKENDPRFYYYVMQTIDFADYVFPGTLPSVNQRVLGNIKVVSPSFNEQSTISRILMGIDEKIEAQNKHLKKIEKIKIGLMATLLTGKIRVRY
ncbi:MAG: restriction endonuclease subunit S [Clostridiales bacterium]|nr:restriction endonuclease subunit S [Clostridiales bacterium]